MAYPTPATADETLTESAEGCGRPGSSHPRPRGETNHPASTPRNRRSGLTLVELLTVIAIISILISILIPTVSTVRTSARKAKARIILTQWVTAMEMFRQEYGFYPAFDFDSPNLIASTDDTAKFVRALSGREVDGAPIAASDTASGNKKRIRFYTFSEGEIGVSGQLVDSFDSDKIAILFDKNYDGIIRVKESEGINDYSIWPAIGIEPDNKPPDWPDGGLRAGVAIYSKRPDDQRNIITTW